MPVLVIPPLTESPLRMQDHSVEKGKAMGPGFHGFHGSISSIKIPILGLTKI